MFTVRIEDAEFNRMLAELAAGSDRTAYEVLTDQCRRLLRKLAFLTPRYRGRKPSARAVAGRARAGWWPAWRALGMNGTPYVNNSSLRDAREGTIEDGRRNRGAMQVVMSNEVPYIEALDDEVAILEHAYADRKADMEGHLEQQYQKEMAKHRG